MLKTLAYVAVAAALVSGGAAFAQAKKPAPPRAAAKAAPAWTVDKAQSRIRFKSSFGGMAFEGGFGRWDAQINFDPKNLAGSKAVVTIDVASVQTGDRDRDETLPTGDWLDTKAHPRATFTSTAFKDLGGGKYQAVGVLNLKGVSKPVTLPFTLAITGNQAKANGSLTLQRNQWNVGQGQFAGADTVPYGVQVNIAVVARRAG
jgi:polyisoprenoid-binding protein YceI